MACDIIGGRTEQCKDAVSGIHAIYLMNYGDLDVPAVTTYGTGDNTDQITAITGGTTSLYKFELKGANDKQFS